jgi:hypothetical protein
MLEKVKKVNRLVTLPVTLQAHALRELLAYEVLSYWRRV